jgi:hypothetical protein
MSIEVCHIDCFNPNTQAVETLRVTSSEDYIANGVAYYPCLAEMLDFDQSLFDKGTTAGSITVGVGTIVLNNADGKLDKYRQYGFDGRTITVYKPRDKYDTVTDYSTLFFTGTVAYAEFGWSKITLYIKSRLEEINVPMQPNSFAGTNLGAGGDGGFEGGAGLTGKTKPQIFGRCSSVSPAPVNDFFLIYGFNYDHDGEMAPLYQIYNVFVKGIRYVYGGTDYADENALMSADLSALGAGKYVTCLIKGLLRLSSTPADNGAVVADVADAPDENCTAAQVADRILQENAAFVPGTDYDAGELQDLDGINICPVGICVMGNETIADCVNQILDSIGAWYIPDSQGVFRFGWVEMPDTLVSLGEQSVCVITKVQWEDDIERVSVADQSQNIPAQSVEIQHTRNWNVQESGSLADAVGMQLRLFFTTEYRSAKAQDDDIVTAHPLAPSLVYKTLLNSGIYLALLNGDFTITLGAAGGGWNADNTSTITQSGGVLTLTPDGATAGEIDQTLSMGDTLYPGVVEVGFTVKATYQVILKLTVGSNVVTATYPPAGPNAEDTSYIAQITVPIAASALSIEFDSIDLVTPFAISSVYARMQQQGPTPLMEAERRLAIQSGFQERYTLSIPTAFYKSNGIDIGRIVTLQDDNRFGLRNGKEFLVIGVDPTDSDFKVQIDVWRSEVQQVTA